MMRAGRIEILFSLGGAVLGYVTFHPYAMLVSSISHLHETGELHLHWDSLLSMLLASFSPMMAPMAAAFALFGGVIGLLGGMILNKRRRLDAAEHENEKKKIAMETLQRLMVTLSHYLLNANMIIGGMVRRSRKLSPGKDSIAALEVIEEQAKKIDAVIAAFRRVTEIKTAHYTDEDHELMIDVTQEIEKALNKTGEWGGAGDGSRITDTDTNTDTDNRH